MTLPVYNTQGQEQGVLEVSSGVFEAAWNIDLVHQVTKSQRANRKQDTSHTKTRGEVRGGGRKPWAQKGTGRARHGSRRSPLWVGGGITFGPRAKEAGKKKINVKMRRGALRSVLSAKARDKQVIIVEGLPLREGKTKAVRELLSRLPSDRMSTLIALPAMAPPFIAAVRNLSYAATCQAKDLNALDVLNARYLVLPKEAVAVLEKTLGA